MKHKDSGVTLVALTVTIIVLAILVGISLNVVVGDNGLINRAKDVSEDADMVKAKEKLQLELANLSGDKISDKNYDEQEYIDNRLISKDMKVYEDYVVVDGWLFEIDRSEPKIKNDLGQGTVNENIQVVAEKTISGDYGEAQIIARVIYNKGTIKTIKIGGEEISFSDNGAGKYEGSKKVTSNGTYNIIAVDTKGNLQFGNITITELTSDLEIYTMEDMNKFKADLKAGKTYQGKNVKLMADLDLGLSETDSWEPIKGFKGTFYGNDYKIKNLYINDTSAKGNQGFFETLDKNASVKDLIIESGKISSNGIGVGVIAGNCYGSIDGCNTKIDVFGNNLVGGITGVNYGIVTNCIVKDSIINGKQSVGGVAGLNYGRIFCCGNNSDLVGVWLVGGVASQNAGSLQCCYNKGSVKATGTGTGADANNSYAGGIVAHELAEKIENNGVKDCYNRGSVSGPAYNVGGTLGYLGYEGRNVGLAFRCYNTFQVSSGTNHGLSYGARTVGATEEKLIILSTSSLTNIENVLKNLGGFFKNDDNRINDGFPILYWEN